MCNFRFLSLSIAIVAIMGCATLPPPATTTWSNASITRPEVILISIDGYRADYLTRGDSPVLEALAADGVRAQWLIPSFPTVTDPNHYTLITGLYPDHNGIVGNTMEDPEIQRKRFDIEQFESTDNPSWWHEATPLWISAQRDGVRAAEVDWPNGQVRIHGDLPDLRANGRGLATPAEVTAKVGQWLGLPATQRPGLILVHYETVDATGHRYGPDSLQLDQALRDVDEAIGRLVSVLKKDQLYEKTDLVLVSDHGMAYVPPTHHIYLDDIINLRGVSLISLNSMASINPHHMTLGASDTAALLASHQHMQCWRARDMPVHLHYGHNPRVPKIDCLATPGWLITTRSVQAHRAFPLLGVHGYDDQAPSMRALFIAEGPSFQKDLVVPAFPNVDVYPLLAHILRISPEKNDGVYKRVARILKHA